MDSTLLKPGDNWEETLRGAMREADGTLVFITQNSASSQDVNAEIGLARGLMDEPGNKKFLIPVTVGKVEVPYLIQGLFRLEVEDGENLPSTIDRIEAALASYINPNNPFSSENPNNPNPPVPEGSQPSGPANYWLIKINGSTWPIGQMYPGFEAHFSAYHHENQRQADYGLFQQVREGDFMIGYAYQAFDAILCVFEVTQALHHDPEEQEVINMRIIQRIDPPLLRSEFKSLITFDKELDPPIINKLVPITLEVFSRLLLMAGSPYSNLSYISGIATDTVSAKSEDSLGFASDYKALAKVIAYKEVNPPLAVGLFGNWGSGKSFFMAKLQAEIKELQKKEPYCKTIVHINFNSWHYSDANLWASLITRIFDGLERDGKNEPDKLENLFKNLSSTQDLLKETRVKQQNVKGEIETLTRKKADLEDQITEHVKDLKNLSPLKIILKVEEDPGVQNEMQAVKDKYEFLDLQEYQEIDKNLKTLETGGNRLIETVKLLLSFRYGKQWIVLLAFVIISVACYLLLKCEPHLKDYFKGYKLVIGAIAGYLAQVVVLLKPALQHVKSAYNSLLSLKKTVEKVEVEERNKYNADREALVGKITSANKLQGELQLLVSQLEAQSNQMESEIRDIEAGRKVVKFIESRVADQRYLNSLGIISWIRKDFEELDYLLKQQYDANKRADAKRELVEGTFQIDRIILYIDDLDRCDVPIVIKVLEAIHLLLAFPLFVVIVGVDPRWMHSALTQQYSNFLAGSDDVAKNDGKVLASSFDYLEKIFQIPLVLKAIDPDGTASLIDEQLTGSIDPSGVLPGPGAGANGGSGTGPGSGTISGSDAGSGSGQASPGSSGGASTPGGSAAASADQSGRPTDPAAVLLLTTEEVKFMKKIGFLIGESPRTVKRFINIYRILRTHSELQLHEGSELEDYCAVMVLLAIITGLPEHSKDVFQMIDLTSPYQTALQFFQAEHRGLDVLQKLVGLLNSDKGVEKAAANMKMAQFRSNIDLVRRFSFRNL
jgi:hypothetical protein